MSVYMRARLDVITLIFGYVCEFLSAAGMAATGSMCQPMHRHSPSWYVTAVDYCVVITLALSFFLLFAIGLTVIASVCAGKPMLLIHTQRMLTILLSISVLESCTFYYLNIFNISEICVFFFIVPIPMILFTLGTKILLYKYFKLQITKPQSGNVSES